MSVTSGVDTLPRELVQLISGRLPPSDHRSLCGTSTSFGQQPCLEFVKRLALTLPDLRQCRGQQQRRQQRAALRQQHQRSAAPGGLSHVGALTIKGLEVHLGDIPPLASDEPSYQPQLVLFVSLAVPNMARLTTLTLSHMLLSSAASAAACLAAACPQLTCVVLDMILVERGDQVPGLPDLWLSLARVRSLRRLKLSRVAVTNRFAFGRADFCGLGAITQLQKLLMKMGQLSVSDLAQLVNLHKLSVYHVLAAPGTGGDSPPDLSHVTHLKRLKVFGSLDAVSPMAACLHLTSLHLLYNNLRLPAQTHAALFRLDVRHSTITDAGLQALPALGELRCHSVLMPQARAGLVTLPALHILECHSLEAPSAGLPVQAVALTFPHLRALKWVCGHTRNAPADELWPTATPAGQLLHLRTFSSVWLNLDLAFAHCAPAAQDLLYKEAKDRNDEEAPHALSDSLPALRLLGRHLRRVELKDTGITDEVLIQMAGSWPLLEEVTLRGVKADVGSVTDGGLSALLRLPRLRRVTLSRCSAVTPSSIFAMASRWCIERIEVCGCALVGAADVLRILRLLGRPQLEIVHSGAEKEGEPWRDGLTL